MSRIGRLPVAIPEGVTVSIDNFVVTVKGPLGELKQDYDKKMIVSVKDNSVIVERPNEDKRHKSMHGLYRTLIANMIEGVTKGFSKSLTIKGVGYKIIKKGNNLVLHVGYSHPVDVIAPEGITLDNPKANEIVVKGIDKAKVGHCAATIKAIRKIEPYHGYGIRYTSESVSLKEGKKAGK